MSNSVSRKNEKEQPAGNLLIVRDRPDKEKQNLILMNIAPK